MDAIKKFSGKAEGYDKYRPSYPRKLIDYYYQKVGFSPEHVIADIGASTGLMSRLLLERGSRALCVEPNADMGAVAWDKLQEYSRWEWIAAPAEDTGLPDQSVDFITVAQAFRWIDQAKFAAECRRILRPKGKVALVWNSRDREDARTRETWQICILVCPDFRGFSGEEETPGDCRAFFQDGTYEQRVFPNDLQMDLDQFLGRYLSASCAPKRGGNGYEEFVKFLTRVFDAYQQDGWVRLSNAAYSYVGEV